MNLSFLYKNYEKIALAIVLIILLLTLLWLVNLFYESEEERNTGITIIVNMAKYDPLPRSYFDFDIILAKSQLWLPSIKRDSDKNDEFYIAVFTDFMKPFKIIRSPAFKSEGKLIPYDYCKIGYCPITKEKISIPDTNILEKNIDTDEDGIPDAAEKQLGTNPTNASDANQDMDKDSFTNLQEYEYGGESFINDAAKHPPLIKRVVLLDISKSQIPFMLKKVIIKGQDKKNWDIQANIKNDDGTKTLFLNIGSTIELNGKEYKIADIVSKSYEKLDTKLGVIVEYDDSAVILKGPKGEDIQTAVNKPTYEQDNIAIVKDLYTGEIYNLKLKGTITLGNDITGFETYELSEIEYKEDSNKEESVSFIRNGKSYIVKKTTYYIKPSETNAAKK